MSPGRLAAGPLKKVGLRDKWACTILRIKILLVVCGARARAKQTRQQLSCVRTALGPINESLSLARALSLSLSLSLGLRVRTCAARRCAPVPATTSQTRGWPRDWPTGWPARLPAACASSRPIGRQQDCINIISQLGARAQARQCEGAPGGRAKASGRDENCLARAPLGARPLFVMAHKRSAAPNYRRPPDWFWAARRCARLPPCAYLGMSAARLSTLSARPPTLPDLWPSRAPGSRSRS